MQKYLNWKYKLLQSNFGNSTNEIFFNVDSESKNLFQYKYKYYNNIIQKNIENGFLFPLVNVKNSEFYYLGKHFMVNSLFNESNAVVENSFSKKASNKLVHKLIKKGIDLDQFNYINTSNYVQNVYYSLNLIKYLPAINNSKYSFSYSNVSYLVNTDGSKIDLIDYGVFDFIANTVNYTNNNYSNIVYYSLVNSEYSGTPEFFNDTTALSSIFTKLYSKYNSKTLSDRVLQYINVVTDNNLSGFFSSDLNNDLCFENINTLLSSSISYEDFTTINLEISNNTSEDYLYTYLFTHINNQLKKSVKSELRNQYKNTLAYIVEAISLKKIELKNKAAEAKIIDDFDHKRIGQRKKQRLLITLYNKQKEEELKREDDKKKRKKQIPVINVDTFTNLDYSLDDLNSNSIRKLSSSNVSDYLLNSDNVYRYEYEKLNNNISSDKSVFFSDINNVSVDGSDVAHLDHLNKMNYYELNSSIKTTKKQIKQLKYNKIIEDEQRSVQIMNCLNNLLSYSESHNFDIEQPSNDSTEINLSKQYKFLKSLFTSYKLNNKFPVLYVPHFQASQVVYSGVGKTINNFTISMYRRKNIHVQLITSRMKGLFYYPTSNLQDNKFNYYTYWDMNCLYYKFVGLLIRHGKRHKAEEILNNSFIFIKNLSLCNPLYIFMKALYNGQTFFEFTKQKKQTKSLLIPRYTPLNKRIKISMRLIANNIRNNDVLRKVKKSKKYNVNTSFLLSNIFISYFFKVGKVKNDLVTNVTNAYKQKHLLKKNVGTFVYNRLLKFLAFRKIRGYHISK